jgi:hypothetical protein
MERPGMPQRAARMRLCGKRYASVAEAKRSKAMPGAELVTGCPCGGVHVRAPRAVPILPAPRRAAGFPARVKLLVRTRAGLGDADDAVCEACGLWLGRKRGQVHHLIGRGTGGCTDAVISSAANAALLCGNSVQGCHGLATAFDAEIGARGFWLKHSADPRLAPMTLHSGARMLRSEDGRYLDAPPGKAAA